MLQALQKRFGPRGFRVLGFPCNDFADEEPDDLPTIQAFCAREYGATYELFDKVVIRAGRDRPAHPLYQWLTSAGSQPGPVSWNFEKFLLDRTGKLAGRWPPKTQPDDGAVINAIKRALDTPAGSA